MLFIPTDCAHVLCITQELWELLRIFKGRRLLMHYYFCATYGYVDKGFRNSSKILGITRTLSQVMKVQLFVKQNMFFTLV